MTGGTTSHALAGMSPGDHACCSFSHDDEQRSLVSRFAQDAVARGERLIYLADRSDEVSISSCLAGAGIDTSEALRTGQVELRPFVDTDLGDGSFDPERQIAQLAAERSRALADGFRGLAAIGEMSWAAGRLGDAERIVRYEQRVSRIFSEAEVTGLCQYDIRLFPAELLSRLVGAHELTIRTGRGWTTATKGTLTVSEHDGGKLVISGDVDMAGADYLWHHLEERLFGRGDVVLDVGGVSFIDVTGCRVLVRAAKALPADRQLVIERAPAIMIRVLSICGWADHPGMVLVTDAATPPVAAQELA